MLKSLLVAPSTIIAQCTANILRLVSYIKDLITEYDLINNHIFSDLFNNEKENPWSKEKALFLRPCWHENYHPGWAKKRTRNICLTLMRWNLIKHDNLSWWGQEIPVKLRPRRRLSCQIKCSQRDEARQQRVKVCGLSRLRPAFNIKGIWSGESCLVLFALWFLFSGHRWFLLLMNSF